MEHATTLALVLLSGRFLELEISRLGMEDAALGVKINIDTIVVIDLAVTLRVIGGGEMCQYLLPFLKICFTWRRMFLHSAHMGGSD
jgi:hypothetical protein